MSTAGGKISVDTKLLTISNLRHAPTKTLSKLTWKPRKIFLEIGFSKIFGWTLNRYLLAKKLLLFYQLF